MQHQTGNVTCTKAELRGKLLRGPTACRWRSQIREMQALFPIISPYIFDVRLLTLRLPLILARPTSHANSEPKPWNTNIIDILRTVDRLAYIGLWTVFLKPIIVYILCLAVSLTPCHSSLWNCVHASIALYLGPFLPWGGPYLPGPFLPDPFFLDRFYLVRFYRLPTPVHFRNNSDYFCENSSYWEAQQT